MSFTRIFVTGATGEIGRALIPRLAEKFEIESLVRDAHASSILPAHVHPVVGDLRKSETYSDALSTCDAVVHLGALTHDTNLARLREVNVNATRALAERMGKQKLIVASSAAVTQTFRTPYAQSKLEMENILREMGNPATIIRPTLVYGPHTRFTRLLCRAADGFFPWITLPNNGSAHVDPVHVQDVSASILALLNRKTRDPQPAARCPRAPGAGGATTAAGALPP